MTTPNPEQYLAQKTKPKQREQVRQLVQDGMYYLLKDYLREGQWLDVFEFGPQIDGLSSKIEALIHQSG